MSEAELKAEKLLNAMNDEEREEAILTYFQIKVTANKQEALSLANNASKKVQELIELIMPSSLEDSAMEFKKEKLKYDASLIRKDAIAILPALIAANPGVSDMELVGRSLAMAQRLHDFC